MNTTSSPTSPSFRKSINACPPTPRLYHQLVDFKGEPVPSFPKLKSAGKTSAQEQEGTLISKKPEGLHFLMTPCSLRSLLPNETYYTKFGECKSTNSQDSKSNKRLRKVSFDLEPRIFSEESKWCEDKEEEQIVTCCIGICKVNCDPIQTSLTTPLQHILALTLVVGQRNRTFLWHCVVQNQWNSTYQILYVVCVCGESKSFQRLVVQKRTFGYINK